MSKKKTKDNGITLPELVNLAKAINFPTGAFDGDLEDACDEEAELLKENIKSSSLYEQLEFLYLHGFSLARLKELIEELAKEKK